MENNKKFNRSSIMKRGWFLVKHSAYTLSEALKRAWAEAKAMKDPEARKQSFKAVMELLKKELTFVDAFGFKYKI